MTTNEIFYYPYASFEDAQAPLLKAAALYFDKLYVLDPTKASWGTIGCGNVAKDLALLESEEILERVSPEEVLNRYGTAIEGAIRADMNNPGFVELCEQEGGAGCWTLALAKVPKAIREDPQFKPLDRSMQHLMGHVARAASSDAARYNEVFAEYTERLHVFDEGGDQIEYRYADYPLALGEAIMMNHALFGGLLHTGATPLTDATLHNRMLNHKMQNVRYIPEIRQVLEQRASQRQLKRDQLAMAMLTDIELAMISPKFPMEEILKFRQKNGDALAAARDHLGSVGRRIQSTPWSKDFADELETKTIPDIQDEMDATARKRDEWLTEEQPKKILELLGIGATGASIALSLAATPLLPVIVAASALAMIGGVAIPGSKLAIDWRNGKQTASENGLSYLMQFKQMGGR